jgi:hypothetical protein
VGVEPCADALASTQHTGTAATEGHAVPGDRTIEVHGVGIDRFNDPSAGSPTETLLRLLLPLGGRV